MAQIITLCELCARDLRDSFALKAYPGKPTTQKQQICEHCRKKYRPEILKQYILSGKGAK